MAYSKTNWVNNTTPIDKDNLNKIEQGIYDNSLVVDAVTNTLNPTDTETYKTAELTEGQITDVIGVNDILIKGQTSQEGEPTPSSPVDVNVVSGSNVINIENENLLDYNAFVKGRINSTTGKIEYENNVSNMKIVRNTISFTTTVAWNSGISSDFILVKQNDYTYSIKNASVNVSVYVDCYDENKNYLSRYGEQTIRANEEKNWLISITNTNVKYIRLHYETSFVGTIILTNTMLKQGSTATTYEPHQGKEFPLDLPVVNLFDKDNANILNGYINGTTKTYQELSTAKSCYISIKPNTTYTISKISSQRFVLATFNTEIINETTATIIGSPRNTDTSYTITTGGNDKYLGVFYYLSTADTLSEETIRNSIQIEQGSKVNAYTPFGTEPLELCKIGDYQDYFYKSGSIWYLHKEINKITSYNGETITTSYISTTGKLSTGAKVYYVVTPTDTKITDTTLISQLDAIYSAPLYEKTNITQTNNDLPMVLDITAFKDNINGIKAFIRK